MKNFMKLVTGLLLTATVLLSGCASPQGNNAVMGSVLGAAFGAVTGDSRTSTERGALLGAILGGLLPVAQQQSQSFNQVAYGNQNGYQQFMGRRNPNEIITDLNPRLCPGGIRHNGQGWTCPGGQLIVVVSQQFYGNQNAYQNGNQTGYYQTVQNAQQQQNGPGCIQAKVDGVLACWNPEYLQTIRRTN